MDTTALKVMFGSFGFGLAGSALGFGLATVISSRTTQPSVALNFALVLAGSLVGQYVGVKLMLGK